jgi:hypothetical protein
LLLFKFAFHKLDFSGNKVLPVGSLGKVTPILVSKGYWTGLLEFKAHPSIHGTTAPSGPWPTSKVASILPYFLLFSSILASLISVMHPSAQHPPI